LDLSRAAKEYRDEDEQNTEQLKNMLANSSRDKRTSFLTYVVDSHVQQELSNVKKLNTQQSIFDLNRSKPAFGDLIAQNKKEQDTVKDQSKDTKEKSAIVKVNNDKQKDTENDPSSSRDKRTSFLTYVVDSHVQQELSNVKKFNRQQSMFDLNRSKPAFGDLMAQNKKEQDTVKDQSKDTKEKSAIVKGNNDKQKDTENDELKTKKFDVPYAQKFNDQEIPSDSVGKIILKNMKNNGSMDQTNYMEPNRYESNHINSLDYLNQNDELTKNQMDDIIADSNKINVNKDLFFTDMDHNIFDFKGESSRKNTGFYNDNFAKNISQLVTINSKEIKRTFHDKTFKIGEKSFVHDGDGIVNKSSRSHLV
ncbi:ankyrin repeat domain-containing protein 11-like, partial [Diaphorina citri]|uniref:Ankyrin repeat domain-containing protein 11-like n=1 Tax=Diaphorina citri TaxID=121845 RepID=A0A3Q0JIA1_DIACI